MNEKVLKDIQEFLWKHMGTKEEKPCIQKANPFKLNEFKVFELLKNKKQ